MCGFILVYGDQLNNKFNFKKFKSTTKLINHRGPDFNICKKEKDYYLYHSRLAIVDLDKRSNQPFYSENKRYILVYNGEIYNYLEIKKKLKTKYNFKTSSDTEVLLAAFLEWGSSIFDHIDGMFSFIVIDKYEKKLFFARDHFGQKPLYYHISKNFISLSSEIKPLLKISGNTELDHNSSKNYLMYNYYAHDEKTFFKSINQIKPGNYGVYHNNKIRTFTYSDFKKNIITQNKKINPEELISILSKSSDEHLMGDVNVGLAVSSGIDSLSLLALFKNSKLSGKLTKCFTLDFGKDFSEFNEARKMTSILGMKTNRVIYSHKEMIKDFETLVNFNEAPIGGVMHLGLSKLCKHAKQKGIKVLFNGTGIDEVLLGYESSIRLLKKNKNTIKRELQLIDGLKINFSKFLKFKKETNNSLYLNNIILDLLLTSKLPKNLHMLDRASMMHSVEMRNPYVNKEMTKYFLNLPYKSFFKGKLTKVPLRDSMQKLFPKINWYNQKKYIQTPQNMWLRKKESIEFFGDIIIKFSH